MDLDLVLPIPGVVPAFYCFLEKAQPITVHDIVWTLGGFGGGGERVRIVWQRDREKRREYNKDRNRLVTHRLGMGVWWCVVYDTGRNTEIKHKLQSNSGVVHTQGTAQDDQKTGQKSIVWRSTTRNTKSQGLVPLAESNIPSTTPGSERPPSNGKEGMHSSHRLCGTVATPGNTVYPTTTEHKLHSILSSEEIRPGKSYRR